MFPALQSKQNQGEKEGENNELSLEPSLSFETKTENSITNDIISSSASETTEEERKFHNFIPIPVIDRLQSSLVYEIVFKTHHESEEVSTELTLGYVSCIARKKKAISENSANPSLSSTPIGIKRMKFSNGEGPNGVSLELKLGLYDPWIMKKKITSSDIDSLSRLLIAKDLVKAHILPQWDSSFIEGIKDGVAVAVWDVDSNSEHQLCFKQWSSNGSYVFNGMWNQDFVRRRQLKKGDEIGLFWDQSNSRFNFSVLSQASRN